jgi:molybdenum cofactor cytidylyltransferase
MRSVSAIVTAAGLSTRFGGPNKLLQPWGEKNVVGAVVRSLLDCGLVVIVVTGRDAEQVEDAVQPAQSVFNPKFESGLGSSIACGVANAPEGGYLIALGDMPGIRPDVVRTLLESYGHADSDAIIAPVYGDEPDRIGHPVLFGCSYRKDLLELTGDEGARSVIESADQKLVRISVPGSLPDFDAPE